MGNKYTIKINDDKASGQLIVTYKKGIWPFRKTYKVIGTLKYVGSTWVVDDGSSTGRPFDDFALLYDDYRFLQMECEFASGQKKRSFVPYSDLPQAKVVK